MDKHQKKQIKRYIAWGCMALLVLLLAVMPLLAGQQAEEDGPQASILSTTVAHRDMETQLIGGGQLASEAPEEVTIPEAVKLTKYLVSNGDTVKKGDPIARVDKVSVMLALEEVQETLDYLAEELADASKDTEPDKVTAQAGGLVKILYAKKGDSVRDVMLRDGALAVLSLDGRMAVEIETEQEFSYGDNLTVTMADGAKITGRAESCVAGVLTVSVEDDDYAIGQTVTVTTRDGTQLGSGELYIHSPWNAVAYHGTVSKVTAKEGDSLTAGKTLFQLEVSGQSSQFQILANQRQEYEALMQELFAMHSTGVVTAPCDGFITGVDKNGAFLLAAQSEEPSWYIQPLSRTTGDTGWTVIPLSSQLPDSSVSGNTQPVIPGVQESPVPPSAEEDNSEVQPAPPCTKTEGCSGLVHEAGCPESDVTVTMLFGYVAKVESVSETGVALLKKPEPIQIPSLADITVDDSAFTSPSSYSGTTYSDGSAIAAGDIVFLPQEGGIQKVSGSATTTPGGQIPGMGDLSGLLGGFGGFGGMGGMGGSMQTFTPYSLETLTIAAVTSQEEMTLEITVDEQDISRLYMGQEATITVEALTGQSFPSTITFIGNTGTNGGGSSKFTVKLTLSKAGDMLPGMNASAYLSLDTTKSVPTIPVAALVEEGSRTMVYTGYNEKEDILENPVEVTTGISDGEYVQVLSGLSVSDTVYYAYYDTLEQSLAPEQGFGF